MDHEQPDPDEASLQPQHDREEGDLDQDAYRRSQPFLTPAAQAFAEHWAKHRNQLKAYLHAFPDASKNAASLSARHLLADPRVQLEIRRIIDRSVDLSALELRDIEQELARIVKADVRKLFGVGEASILHPHDWDADVAAAVSSVKVTTTTDTKGNVTVNRTVRLFDKHAAARTLAELKGGLAKHKPPPGVMASFHFSFAGQQQPSGGLVVEMNQPDGAIRPKGGRIRTLQAPQAPAGRVQTPAKGVKRPVRTVELPTKRQSAQPVGESVEISTPKGAGKARSARAAPVEISTPAAQTVQQKPRTLFGDAA